MGPGDTAHRAVGCSPLGGQRLRGRGHTSVPHRLCPPLPWLQDLRRKAARLVAAKCTLAARVDSFHESTEGKVRAWAARCCVKLGKTSCPFPAVSVARATGVPLPLPRRVLCCPTGQRCERATQAVTLAAWSSACGPSHGQSLSGSGRSPAPGQGPRDPMTPSPPSPCEPCEVACSGLGCGFACHATTSWRCRPGCCFVPSLAWQCSGI